MALRVLNIIWYLRTVAYGAADAGKIYVVTHSSKAHDTENNTQIHFRTHGDHPVMSEYDSTWEMYIKATTYAR